jgi:Zn-dependent protease
MTLADARPAKPAPISPNALILIVIFTGLAFALARLPEPPGVLTFAFVVAGWILSVSIHEFAHAFVAYKAGDHTIAEKGYLTLDPLKYTDLSTSLILPLLALALGGIGFPGGAVYLRTDLMRSRLWRTAASLAGPAVTAAIFVGLAVGLNAWAKAGAAGGDLYPALSVLVFLQAMALILNLLPIPGLDGFNAIRPFLPKSWTPGIRKAEGVSLLILLALVFAVPGAGAALFRAAARLSLAAGLDPAALNYGWNAFHFWR